MIVATAPEFSQKCDFFPGKRMKRIFAYVLEFTLTFHKMQIIMQIATIIQPTKIVLSRYIAGFISDTDSR